MIRFNHKILFCVVLATMGATWAPSIRADETAKEPTLAERDTRAEYFQAVQKAKELAVEQQRNKEQLQKMECQLLEATKQIEASKKQWQIASSELAKRARDDAKAQIQGGELKVFHLKKLPAENAAQSLDSLFSRVLRVAVDDRTNSLIVLGNAESLPKVEALLSQLDRLPQTTSGAPAVPEDAKNVPRTMFVKLFWLADGLAPEEGQEPDEVLPANVLRATTKLGVVNPRLVAQIVSAIVVRGNEAAEFSVNMPAQLLQQDVRLSARGHVFFRQLGKSDSMANVDIRVDVKGKSVGSELAGSLAMPVDHFMVLGTSSSVMAEPTPQPTAPIPGDEGRTGGAGYGILVQSATRKLKTSRFALVVQVVNAESFAREDAAP